MALGGLAFVLGSALQAAAPEIVQLVIGRILLGIGIGFANQVAAASSHRLESRLGMPSYWASTVRCLNILIPFIGICK